MHTDANRQRNSTRATHQQNIIQSTQSHGDVLPLAKGFQSMPKVNVGTTGDLALRTWQITLQCITQPHATRLYVPQYSQLSTILNTGNSLWNKICHPLRNCHPLRSMSNLAGKIKIKQQKSTQHWPKCQLLQNPSSKISFWHQSSKTQSQQEVPMNPTARVC